MRDCRKLGIGIFHWPQAIASIRKANAEHLNPINNHGFVSNESTVLPDGSTTLSHRNRKLGRNTRLPREGSSYDGRNPQEPTQPDAD
ncbi:hypothetical protein G9C98_006453 [Cotesia typhae]|uniref:Uncharacterized protein n=1 Tax=Cotesia typhae TaxID=2053667 RepID=A0A8J5QQ02_9HYME|nr:hypothetical protein G9C98_006453 [Cotesia typhae]